MKAGYMTRKVMMCSLLCDEEQLFLFGQLFTFIQGFFFIVRMTCVLCVHGWKTGYLGTRQHKHQKTQQCNPKQQRTHNQPTQQEEWV